MSSPPATLGQYQIIREIARSNDIVYEAYDPLMNRRVAVKELNMPPGMTAQQREERIARFKREAQAAGTLNHPNIMTVFSFAEDAGRTFMAMEYLDGHTLRNELDTKGALPLERGVEIACAVLEGLAHAHNKGVIHRDVKPDNVQILSSGAIKITDFGIARLTFQPNLTMDGQVFGTPSYMSPEQVVGREIDARSDLFSVGVMLYEMVAGQKPFTGDSVVSITYAIMNNDPAQPTGLPWQMWEVIGRALEKSPSMRYVSAGEMAQALQDALRGPARNVAIIDPMTGAASPAYGTPAPAPQPAPAPPVYPYNPYGGVAPQSPGYGVPPPGGYTQAPYQPQPYSQQPYIQPQYQQPYTPPPNPGHFMPPPGPAPIYYPPPPKQPLFKPETAAFLRRLAITAALVGTLFALVTVGLSALMNAINMYRAEQEDRQVQISKADPRIPVAERIRLLESRIAQLKSPAKIEAANRDLAVLYEEQGNERMTVNDLVAAEYSFLKATSLDSHNAKLFTDLGKIYAQRANNEPDRGEQASLWYHSGEQWQKAADQEPDREVRNSYKTQTARMFFNYAYVVSNQGDRSSYPEARRVLYMAQENAPEGSQLADQIKQLLTTIS